MLKIFIAVVVIILLTIGIVRLIDRYLPKKAKPVVLLVLWILIAFFAYKTYRSVYGVIEFNKIKNQRYVKVIDNLIDIRDSQLAHRSVTGKYSESWDGLVKFIDTAEYTITQRRDSSILDVEATRRFGGVETFKDIVIIDTLGTVPVKDSLFGVDTRYKTMMNLPVGDVGKQYELEAGTLEEDGIKIPVFEVRAPKRWILNDQPKNLVDNECEVQSVDGVNGEAIRVGSMTEVKTNGNWPKNFRTQD